MKNGNYDLGCEGFMIYDFVFRELMEFGVWGSSFFCSGFSAEGIQVWGF